jgi:hypothetical protein
MQRRVGASAFTVALRTRNTDVTPTALQGIPSSSLRSIMWAGVTVSCASLLWVCIAASGTRIGAQLGRYAMFKFMRCLTALAAAIGLASCAATQNATAPGTAAPSMPAAATAPITTPGHTHHKYGPNDVVGGNSGFVGPGIKVDIGDVALPNGMTLQSLNLGIDEVLVTDGYGNVTTVAQYSTPQVVNILAYQGGNTTPIAAGNVPATTYASLTIVVDTATSNAVSAGGSVRPLKFSGALSRSSAGFGASSSTSQYNSGAVAITFKQAFQVTGSSINLDVDFNAMESVRPLTSSPGFAARPSLSVAQEGFEGSISGNLVNGSQTPVTNAVVVATTSNGTVAATGFTDANGNFLLHTLVAGAYQLTVYNQYVTATGLQVNAANNSSWTGTTVAGPSANVVAGQTSNVGTIQD